MNEPVSLCTGVKAAYRAVFPPPEGATLNASHWWFLLTDQVHNSFRTFITFLLFLMILLVKEFLYFIFIHHFLCFIFTFTQCSAKDLITIVKLLK